MLIKSCRSPVLSLCFRIRVSLCFMWQLKRHVIRSERIICWQLLPIERSSWFYFDHLNLIFLLQLTSYYNETSWTNASEMDTIVGEEPEQLSLVSIVVVGKVNVVERVTSETDTSIATHTIRTTRTITTCSHTCPLFTVYRQQNICSSISAEKRMWLIVQTHTYTHIHVYSYRHTHTHTHTPTPTQTCLSLARPP